MSHQTTTPTFSIVVLLLETRQISIILND